MDYLTVCYSDTELGLDVLPTQVRLRPRRQDQYQWSVKDAYIGTLFKTKDISNATIGDFSRISKALDKGRIKAVIPPEEDFPTEVQYNN